MMRTLIFTIIIAAMCSVQVQAQMVCGAREAIVGTLKDKYGESLQSIGLNSKGVIEVYGSEETGSWTIVTTDTRGASCVMAAGEGFEVIGKIEEKGDEL